MFGRLLLKTGDWTEGLAEAGKIFRDLFSGPQTRLVTRAMVELKKKTTGEIIEDLKREPIP